MQLYTIWGKYCLKKSTSNLLNLTKSPDQKIAVKACEGLMLLVGLPEARAARFLVECTSLGAIVCSKLNSLIKNLPMNVDPADVEATEAKWGLDPYSAKEDKTGFVGKRNLKITGGPKWGLCLTHLKPIFFSFIWLFSLHNYFSTCQEYVK